jgi:hypothetical protein
MTAEDRIGRRAATREGVLRSGKIVIGSSVVDCIVLDVSEKGARVRLGAMMILPETVMLCLRGGVAFNAVTRWARGQEAGLEFVGAPALTARSAARAAGLLEPMQASDFDASVAALREVRYFDDPALEHLAGEARAAYGRLAERLAHLARVDVWEAPEVFDI